MIAVSYPPKFTPERVNAIVESIRSGSHIEAASEAAGIARKTFYEWLKIGEAAAEGTPERDFAVRVKAARSEAENNAVRAITGAFGEDWRAASWYLEHAFPDVWGPRQKVEHSGSVGVALTPDAIRDKLRAVFGGVAPDVSGSDPGGDPPDPTGR